MPILEKAYSKYNAFYANINGGTPLQSFRDLTGMPSIRYYTMSQSIQQLFDIIREANKKNWVLSGACDIVIQGLQDAHAYTILDVVNLTDYTGN